MQRITSFCVRHPWLTLLVACAVAVVGARSSLRNEVDLGLGVTLGADHAVVREFEAFLERFGGGYPVLTAYECVARSGVPEPARPGGARNGRCGFATALAVERGLARVESDVEQAIALGPLEQEIVMNRSPVPWFDPAHAAVALLLLWGILAPNAACPSPTEDAGDSLDLRLAEAVISALDAELR
jgi:hypothetical protein